MSMEESISLEETNKIRISLGLKPLTDDSAPADDREKQAEDNYAKQREKEAKEREAKRIQENISKVRNRRELNAKLKGSTLGDADGHVDDTLKWIKKSKKREKELARKRQEELEDMEKAFQEEYTEKDLAGLRVSHDFEGMDEGEARILTLKDSRILDNEEDELQNVEMAEHERVKKNQELKIKRRDYTGYDDEEFAPGAAGMKRSLLSKYDEFLEGPKETGFRLGTNVTSTQSRRDEREQAAATVNKSLLSIDYAKNIESEDYLKEGDVGFKKPKTKKKRASRRVAAEDHDIPPPNGDDQMQVDEKPIVPRPRNLDTNFVDDDELQAALARSRRAKLQKAKKLSPEDIARRVAEERTRSEAPNGDGVITIGEDGDADGESGLTFDDTSEFVRAITYEPTLVKKESPAATAAPVPMEIIKPRSPSVDVKMEVEEAVEELEAGEVRVKEEEDDEEMLNAIENAIKETEAAEKAAAEGTEVPVGTLTEQTYSAGMASTLNILRQQGILAAPTADQKERERVQLQRDLWLADYRRTVAQRELERAKMRGGNKDQATREYENRLREQQEARQNLESFKNYKPDVNIVYYDEFGRELTPKEAWKALSHKFHGKGSGRIKTEKRLKKIAEEKKKEAMASGDTPLSMNQAFQIRQEKAGQAHFVLSVGNRGAVPQAAEFLDAQPLSKGKTEKRNKKKNAAKSSTPQLDSSGFMTLPAPMANGSPTLMGSPAIISGASPTSTGSPAPRPGFSRISAAAEPFAYSKEGTPVPSDRTKLVIGLGAKRKAVGEAAGSPPPKKR
ncbi:SART-1 protein [Laetiporus sulphureus 93-53]|uniref:SART-1 protein n=1 Tax=Laetiporus sulphureus 93-53 TaxID=1314785 RepID=A0A165BDF1_9APHY|nr:SART-1 protein [Laetiporus sulphureus 93-53]KZT00800.1 SART-1 protein [Laetiporus sulphureus 93-53]